MSPIINLDHEVIHQLDDYAESLRAERPSAELNARMEAAIAAWASEHRVRGILHRPLTWVVVAASVAIITAGVTLLVIGERGEDTGTMQAPPVADTSPVSQPTSDAVSRLATTGGQVSLFPTDGAVFRVKANLASAVIHTSGEDTNGERQYWVDVRIANDGTMRIMQVLPAEHSRIVPRE